MNKVLLTSVALLLPTFAYAAKVPTVVVVNHAPSGATSDNVIIKIPVGQNATLVKSSASGSLVQEHDESGNVLQATSAVIKPLFIEHISTMPGKTAQGSKDVDIKITYTFNYTLGVVQSNETSSQQTVVQKQNSYTNTVTAHVPYGQVDSVSLTLPPHVTGNDEVMNKLFPAGILLTISATK